MQVVNGTGIISAFLTIAVTISDAAVAFQMVPSSITATTPPTAVSAVRLHQIFDEEWQRTLRENPTQASQLGDRRYNKLWPDTSLNAIRASQAKTRDVLAAARALDKSAFSEEDKLNARSLSRYMSPNVAELC